MGKPQNDRESDLLTITQAAALLNVSAVSLRRWTDSGRLQCLRVGARRERRFRREDLLALLEREAGANGRDPMSTHLHAGQSGPRRISLEGMGIDHGSHICSVYESDRGRTKLAAPFLLEGLANGELCVLVASADVQNQMLVVLRELRPALRRDLADGRLILSDGTKDLSAMLRFWEDTLTKAALNGESGVRVVGDMAWVLDKGLGEADLADFEMRYDRTIARRYPLVSLCQYDARRFDGSGILHAMACHTDTHTLPLSRFLVN